AVAALVGGTAWLATGTGGDEPADDSGTAATSPSESASSTTPAATPDKPYQPSKGDFLGEPATIRGGEAYLAKGWREISRVDNPMNYADPNNSLGLEVRKGAEHKFVLLVEQPGDYGPYISVDSHDAVGTLESWLPEAVDRQRVLDADQGIAQRNDTDETTGPLVTMNPDGTLEPAAGLTIVAQVNDIDLGSRFAGPGDDTAAARVAMPTGKDVYVVVRRTPGHEAEVIRGGNAGTFPTIQAFLDHARGQYGDGTSEGLQ
ncbi:hypothetical protein, partial [Nocardioides jensenii]|uniref:hypothetical protein n=1 Tax=Nocardioides jensenii TaxID=1843 RepID=UPI000A93B0D8